MAWVKLDDDFFSNPKVMRAGRDARDLYLAALCFCNRGLTDGHIPQEALRRLAADADIDNVREAAERLIAVGLWDACDGGYQIHDYLEYQPSRERVNATREVRAEAGSRGGKQRAANEQANAKQIATETQANSQKFASESFKQNPTPSRSRPVPVSQPVNDQKENDDSARAARVVESLPLAETDLPENVTTLPTAPRSEPYVAWAGYCEAAGLDISAAPEDAKSRGCGLVKKLLEAGHTADEIAACTGYLRSQSWRTSVVSLKTLSQEIGPWKMLGKPAVEKARASPNGKPPDEFAALRAKRQQPAPDDAIDTTWSTR